MLALIGPDGDPVSDALVLAADRAGLAAVRVRDPAAWQVTIRIDEDGHASVDLRDPAGAQVTCAVNRSLPATPGLRPGESNDLLASWWAALALLPGRVVNRPGPRGFLPAPQVPAVYLATRARHLGPGQVANVHDAHTGSFLYRAAGAHQPADAPVLRVTPFDPDRTWRLMLAGDQVIDLHVPVRGLTARDRASGAAAVSTFLAAGLGLALIVLSDDGGDRGMRTVAVNPLPSLAHYRDHAPRVHAALLKWLAE